MRYVAFVALTEDGQVAVDASGSIEDLRKIAAKARDTGLVKIGGKNVPIIGGCVFASDALLQGPASEFRCLTPDQRKAKADAAAKAKADAENEAKADAENETK